MRRFVCGLAVLTLAVAAGAAPPEKADGPDKKPGTTMPELRLKQPEALKVPAPELGGMPAWVGKTPVRPNKELAGKVLLVHFWSTGSQSSFNNFVEIADWRKKYKDDGLQVVAIHTCDGNQSFPYQRHDENVPATSDEEAELKKLTDKIKKAAAANPAVAETGVDTTGELKRVWKVRHTPTFFLIDKKGNLRYVYEGFLEYQTLHHEKAMREKLEALLKEETDK
jgi:hypothetical protein